MNARTKLNGSRTSAAHITVPKRPDNPQAAAKPATVRPAQARAKPDYAAAFSRLKDLHTSIADCNANDRATVMIEACISAGYRTERDIVRALTQLGFKSRHAAIVLRTGAGRSAQAHRWGKGGDGRYGMLN